MSDTRQRLDNIAKAVAQGKITATEARDERIATRLTAVADARRARDVRPGA